MKGRKKLTNEEFINRAKSILGDNYSFEHTKYFDNKTNVIITCKEHGDFLRKPKDLLYYEEGCPYCKNTKISKTKSFTKQQFIKKAESKFGLLYNYALVNYINNHTKINIICKKHGIFSILPYYFLRIGCPFCRKEKSQS